MPEHADCGYRRLRQCKTEIGNSKVDDIMLKARDRDSLGSVSILQTD